LQLLRPVAVAHDQHQDNAQQETDEYEAYRKVAFVGKPRNGAA
jgi:hypothetical protein